MKSAGAGTLGKQKTVKLPSAINAKLYKELLTVDAKGGRYVIGERKMNLNYAKPRLEWHRSAGLVARLSVEHGL